tara:strand:- start:8783 stop:9016 length:234 start_codon:yes stop_codon:yes gene_type:complete
VVVSTWSRIHSTESEPEPNVNHTTRRYPRTLLEAFPHDRKWAYSVERTKAPMGALEAVIAWASITGMCLLFAWAVVA